MRLPLSTAVSDLGHHLRRKGQRVGPESLELHADALSKIKQYVQVYQQVLGAERMCLCGILAAEFATLPEQMQRELRQFFDQNEAWLVNVLEEGKRDGALEFYGSARDVAGMLTGALEGSMLLAGSYRDSARFGASAQQLVKTLVPRRNAHHDSR